MSDKKEEIDELIKQMQMHAQMQRMEKEIQKMIENDLFNFDEYSKEREKYGDDAVEKFKEMKKMTMDQFMKSEFYKDLLKDK